MGQKASIATTSLSKCTLCNKELPLKKNMEKQKLYSVCSSCKQGEKRETRCYTFTHTT